MVLGLPSLRETVVTSLDAAKAEALNKLIPNYSTWSTLFRRWQERQKNQGDKSSSSIVNEREFNSAVSRIKSEISGTWNPLRWAWQFVLSFFGYSQQERIASAVRDLEGLSHKDEAYKFVNDAQTFLLDQIEKRISITEGSSSKYLGTTNKNAANGRAFTALKSALKSWTEPYDRINHREVAEVGKLDEGTIRFLDGIRSRILYSPHVRYLEDLIPIYDRLIQEAQTTISTQSYYDSPPHSANRSQGQRLAQQAI